MTFKMKGWSAFTKNGDEALHNKKWAKGPKKDYDDSVMPADQMRMYRKMSDKMFNEKAKNMKYTPQTKQRRLVVDLLPATKHKSKKDVIPQSRKDESTYY